MSSQTHGFLFQFSHGSKSDWDGVQKLIIVNLEGVEYKRCQNLGKKEAREFLTLQLHFRWFSWFGDGVQREKLFRTRHTIKRQFSIPLISIRNDWWTGKFIAEKLTKQYFIFEDFVPLFVLFFNFFKPNYLKTKTISFSYQIWKNE